MQKIAFSDIDGTLLNANREPSPALKTEVSRLTANGIPFILISSRMPQAMTWIQEDLGVAGLPLVAYNGGLVITDGEIAHSIVIPLMIVSAMLKAGANTSLSIQLFYNDEWYVDKMDHYAQREQHNTRVDPQVQSHEKTFADWMVRQVGAHKIMVMGDKNELDAFVWLFQNTFGDELHLYRSKDDYLEIACSDISKLTGIEYVLGVKYPNLSLADCIAFGDNYNDIEMLQGVGLGVAVANAKPEVLAVADLVAGPAKEDGVAVALRTYVP